ncbi:MAG: phosphoglycolate phosphatase [Burkholderiales bacterium]
MPESTRMTLTRAVLFDFDGTLADTAPDLAAAANVLLQRRDKPVLPEIELRPWASHGARGLILASFGITPADQEFNTLRDEFLDVYGTLLTQRPALFAGIKELLGSLEARNLPWGIVTNKAERFTHPIVAALGLSERAGTIVCGDTTPHAKPHPEPLLHAARALQLLPENCVYVGDDERDIVAGRAAGMRTIAAAYGYCASTEPASWQADTIIYTPSELLNWL